MKHRIYKPADRVCARAAVRSLRDARDYLRAIGARRSLEKVRRALKSAEGALRHVERTERAT